MVHSLSSQQSETVNIPELEGLIAGKRDNFPIWFLNNMRDPLSVTAQIEFSFNK